jgi:biotin carboxyl carrier protein
MGNGRENGAHECKGQKSMKSFKLNIIENEYDIQVEQIENGVFHVVVNGKKYTAQIEDELDRGILTAVDGYLYQIELDGEPSKGEITAVVNNIKRTIDTKNLFRGREVLAYKESQSPESESPISPSPGQVSPKAPSVQNGILAPMPGKVVAVKVNLGEEVKAGDVVLILEAMKMENEIITNRTGKISDIRVKEGDSVDADDVLVVIE